MLEQASLYLSQLQDCFMQIHDDLAFQYLYSISYRDPFGLTSNTTWSAREFVSVHNGKVIGYLKYKIDRDSDVVHGLQVVNFTGVPSVVFSKDLLKFIRDIFQKYGHRKLSFMCFTDNPILESYKRLCLKHGGRIIGVKKEEDRLLDGKYHDLMMFEILAKDFKIERGRL